MKSAPLTGLRILVGRAHHQASVLSSALRDHGAEVLEIPFIEIRPPRSYRQLDKALKNLDSYDWMILTSVNGVESVWNRLTKLRIGGQPRKLKIAAIGPATKNSIERYGFKVDVVPKEYVAESVVRSLRKKVKGKRILLARAKVARDIIPKELRKAGARVDVVEAYETIIPRAGRSILKAAMKNNRPHVIVFTSSSTVKNFAALLGSNKLDGIRTASIGPVTSQTLRDMGFQVHIEAAQYTIPGLVAAILKATE
jgi:uroporphyrinogen-III synthase